MVPVFYLQASYTRLSQKKGEIENSGLAAVFLRISLNIITFDAVLTNTHNE
jgi:hypothetical protein